MAIESRWQMRPLNFKIKYRYCRRTLEMLPSDGWCLCAQLEKCEAVRFPQIWRGEGGGGGSVCVGWGGVLGSATLTPGLQVSQQLAGCTCPTVV